MAKVLEMAHFSEQHRVPEMKIGRCGIETRFDAQRTAGFYGTRQALAQFLLTDQLGQAFLQVSKLFVNWRKRRFVQEPIVGSRSGFDPVCNVVDDAEADVAGFRVLGR